MRLADKTIETHSIGVASTKEFSIARSAKMFNILSNSLYSDKIMAVIRELSTNAHDSHVSCGNPRPFLVKLPCTTDPNFCVRDYGTGLSQSEMEDLYTTYGASTKNDSNDFVGCLGLGSKSPFAYTKSFTATSYYNGNQYTYVAAIDDAGVPTLNLFHSCETSEPNGLEISFAVKSGDFYEFSQKATRIFHYFKNKPTIIGGVSDFSKEYSRRSVVLEGNGWKVCKYNNDLFPTEHHCIDSGVVAIMGSVAYPVKVSHLFIKKEGETPEHIARWNKKFSVSDSTNWETFLSNISDRGYYLELEFGIGEIEMDVSREGLQYTKDVIKTLKKKTQEIYAELQDLISEKISIATTLIEANCLYNKFSNLATGLSVSAKWTDPDGVVHDISSGRHQDKQYSLPNHQLYVMNYRSTSYRSKRMVYMTDSIHYDTMRDDYTSYYAAYNAPQVSGIKFFFCDIATTEKAKKIALEYAKTNNCFTYLLINTLDHKDVGVGCDDLLKDVGKSNFLKVSAYTDLVKYTRNPSSKPGVKKGSVSDSEVFLIVGDQTDTKELTVGYNDAFHMRSLNESRLESFMEEDQIIYVSITRYATSNPDSPAISKIVAIKDFPEIIGTESVYAIKTSSVQKLEKEGLNLITFDEWFKERITDLMTNSLYQANKIANTVKIMINRYGSPSYPWDRKLHHKMLFGVVDIFGLEYGQYITDTDLVDCIDQLLLYDFFTNQAHKISYDICRFKEKEYYTHIEELIKKYCTEDLDSTSFKHNTQYINRLDQFIHKMYNKRISLFVGVDTTSDSLAVNLKSVSDIQKSLKQALDRNPLMKYIMDIGTHSYCSLSGLHEKMDSNDSVYTNKQIEQLRLCLGGCQI
jgi:hypothetical protein